MRLVYLGDHERYFLFKISLHHGISLLNPEQFLPLYYLYVRLVVSFSYNYYVIISNANSNSLFLCRPTQLKT